MSETLTASRQAAISAARCQGEDFEQSGVGRTLVPA